LSAFSLSDGSFCHEKGLETNMTSTTQAFYALISVQLLRDSGKSLYVYQQGKDVPPETEPSSETETASTKDEGASGSEASETDSADQTSSDGTDSEKTEPDQTEPGKTESDQTNSGQNDPGKSDPGQNDPGQNGRSSRKLSYKVYACAGVLVLVLAASLIQYFRKKRRFKNYLSVFLVGLGAVLLILFTDLKLPDSYYSGPVSHKEHPIGQVVLTIRCDTIKNEESPYIPKDGVILKDTVFEIEENDTVFDVLTEAVRAFNIQMETKGSVFSAHGQTFVSGLNYLYEFDYGELSGWVYHVNSITASVGAGEYVLKDGDYIEWLYTRDLGKDVEEGSSPLY
ncbi:MAG: DUF4430 domain-containing protein, partial [Lachnospiraceae bacterium]|nr:DUF4430 domain-containing protein [Lachnospiraceae bacterium]